MFDVAIIGAGPAGSCCAKILANEGYSVKIYERRTAVGEPKRCAEGLEKKAELYTGRIPARAIAQRIKGARIYAPNGKYLEAVVEGGGYVLERKVFDKWLATEAAKAGTEIQCNSLVTDFIFENGYVAGVKGEYEGGSFAERAKIVIAATGAESPVSRKAGINTVCIPRLIDSCLQYEMANVKSNPHFIHIYLGNVLAPRGYAWIFPKGNGTANVGLGVVPGGKKAKHYLDAFVGQNKELKGATTLEINAGGVPVGGLLKDMVSNGFVVCGEAAHHVNPIHGGGIKEAIVSGQIAAKVVAKALKRNDVSKKSLSEYNTLWWKERGCYLTKVEKIREIIEKLSDDDFNDLVGVLKPADVIELTRGSRLGVLAKALARNPKLIRFVKALI